MSKTRLALIPISTLPVARDDAKFTAVVVFEQPPLWLTTAITTGFAMFSTNGLGRLKVFNPVG
jgi:hypothetical protein